MIDIVSPYFDIFCFVFLSDLYKKADAIDEDNWQDWPSPNIGTGVIPTNVTN